MFLLLLWRPAVDDVHSADALDNNNTEEWNVDYSFFICYRWKNAEVTACVFQHFEERCIVFDRNSYR